MTAKFPDFDQMFRESSTRGGKNTGESAKKYNKVQIDLKTEMPCGDVLQGRERVYVSKQFSTVDSMRSKMKRDGYRHLAQCNKKQCKARRESS